MAAPIFARGVAKTLAVAAETSYGTNPAMGGQLLRRNTSSMDVQVQQIDSAEILVSQQQRDSRLGPRKAMGMLNGNLSPLTYELLFSNLLRGTFTAGVVKTAVTDSVLAVPAAPAPMTLTSPVNGAWLASGFKVGDVVRLAGEVVPDTIDNTTNMQVTAVTPTVLSLAPNSWGELAYTTGQTISVTTYGKKLIVPNSYATQQLGSLTFEHWYADAGISEVASGCRITGITLNIPASGYCTFQAQFQGQNVVRGTVQTLPAAAAETTTSLLTSSNGSLLYNGVPCAVITGMNISITAASDMPAVVGTNISPNVFVGTLTVRGSLTALMINDTLTNDFLSENEVQIAVLLTTSTTANSDFVQIFLPRVKLTSETKNDSDREITRSFNFVALEQSVLGGTGLAYDDTVITIQDSLAA